MGVTETPWALAASAEMYSLSVVSTMPCGSASATNNASSKHTAVVNRELWAYL